MSSSEPNPGEPGLAQWRSIAAWLGQEPSGEQLLEALASSGGGIPALLAEQLARLSHAPEAPQALTAAVTGGHVDKLVQIARADTVNILLTERDGPAPAQLPPEASHFVNRTTELNLLRCALTSAGSETRILAVTSKAGAGKSTLAVRFAHEVAGAYPDVQLYVDLRGADAPVEPAHVLDGFLRALGLRGNHIPASLQERQALYRSVLSKSRALLLLDNAEDERQVKPLLPGGSNCVVIITSRRPMAGLDLREQVILDTLSPHHAVELLGRLAGVSRIDSDAGAAEDVARYCGYLPLALRIAGSRLRVRPLWPMRELADRLRDERRRLDELTAGDQDVRTSFELSYRHLDPSLARAFRLLGLVPGVDFGVQAAAAVLGCDERTAERLLEEIVDVALLESAPGRRYRFHDLIRLFACEKTVVEEDDSQRHAARTRALRLYCDEATSFLSRAIGEFQPHPDAVAWFDEEAANALDAAEIAYANAHWDIVLDLANSLHHLLSFQGRGAELERLFTLAVSAAARAGKPHKEANALVHLAEILGWHRRDQETSAMFEKALALADDIGDSALRAKTLTHLGDSLRELGRPLEARKVFQEALVIIIDLGDPLQEAWVLTHLGGALCDLKQPGAALEAYKRALDINDNFDRLGGRAWVLRHMSGALDDLDRFEDAKLALHAALEINLTNGDLIGQEWVLKRLAEMLSKRHCWAEAASVFQQASTVAARRGDQFAVREWTELASRSQSKQSPPTMQQELGAQN
jgi:tetratricopeptide (TPR) repeat protein